MAGPYPKIFVASGASVPANAPGDKVVHVPYTQLLKADGTPKEAKDIWVILEKAGVNGNEVTGGEAAAPVAKAVIEAYLKAHP